VTPAVEGQLVTLGGYHGGAVKSDGTVWMWGNNQEGQLGWAAGEPAAKPQALSLGVTVSKLSAGGFHTLAVAANGQVISYGRNGEGQLGRSGGSGPGYVGNLSGVTAVAAGGYHSLALKSDGTVWAWGANWNGQLGDGEVYYGTLMPWPVSGLSNVVAIAAGMHSSYALKSDGTVWAWGSNGMGQLGDGTFTDRLTPVQVSGLSGITAIAAGWEHAVALKSNGTAWAWGSSWSGQIGSGNFYGNAVETPQQVAVSGVTGIAAGANHTLLVKSDGSLWSSGGNHAGQLGNGQAWNNQLVMSPGATLLTSGVTQVAAGGYTTLALRSDGVISGFGYLEFGQLGDGLRQARNRPVPMLGIYNARSIDGGDFHTAVLKQDGSLAWSGLYNTQNLYLGNSGDDEQQCPGGFAAGPYVQLASGKNHTLVLKADGTVWGWGESLSGQLGGLGTVMSMFQVAGISNAIQIAAACENSAAVKADGTVWAWGKNDGGQLGNGTTTAQSAPGAVSGLSGVVRVAVGDKFMVAVKADGTVWAWGDNTGGKLLGSGDGLVTTPTQISGLSKIVAVAAGNEFALALKENGTVWAWGLNESGQLGCGNTTNRGTVAQISGLAKVVAIAAGARCGLALLHGGTVQAWGDNFVGQLGDDSYTNRLTPVSVAGLSQVVAIGAGQQHGMAVKSDGSAWAWGNGGNEQLGVSQRTEHRGAIRLTTNSADTDADGVPDAWEVTNFGNLAHDGTADGDHDGLTDMQEYLRGTNPNNPDADADGLVDGADPVPLTAGSYTAATRQLTAVSGNNQSGTGGQFLSNPFVVQVSGGAAAWRGYPVAFTAAQSLLASGTGGALSDFIVQYANPQGQVGGVYFKLPASGQGAVQVSSQGQTLNLYAGYDPDEFAAEFSGVDIVIGDDGTTVSWDGAFTSVTGFAVQRSNDGGATWQTVASVGPNDRSVLLANQGQNAGSLYRVTANCDTTGSASSAGAHGELAPDSDYDGDGVVNYQDARPGDASVGALTVTIASPGHGTSI
jgi:alpha-tubulin suppressor-like RCC1 family protein